MSHCCIITGSLTTTTEPSLVINMQKGSQIADVKTSKAKRSSTTDKKGRNIVNWQHP